MRHAVRHLCQLSLDLMLNLRSQVAGSRHEKACRVLGVFRLSKKVRSNPSGIAMLCENNGLCRACGQVDCTIIADDLLGGSDELVSRPEDLIHSRYALRAVGERRNRLRATNPRDSFDSEDSCHSQ